MTSVIVRCIKAELTISVNSYGRMDPYAIVKWIATDGSTCELARTRTDWNAHLTPQWDCACRAKPHSAGAKVEFQVFEDDFMYDTFCGKVSASIEDLAGEEYADAIGNTKSLTGPMRKLNLEKDGATTGVVTVQVLLVDAGNEEDHSISLTPVSVELFETPARQIKVSGGTAPFFHLNLRNPKPGESKTRYIGKDLSRATDEVEFYERLLKVGKNGGLARLLAFTFEYAGVLTCQVTNPTDGETTKELLVMQNLRDGCSALRMLDLKIGQQTAQAGWQGKSRIGALRQNVVDGVTNSAGEGYRLEGFDGVPPVLKSMDPLLDVGGSTGNKASKKAFRIMLQRMNGADVLMHYIDMHQCLQDVEGAGVERLSPTELSEIVLHESVFRLARLAIACRHAPVPQKWIGSSVALGFDCGQLPLRTSVDEARRSVKVNIFDWGRSELNTLRANNNMTEVDQHDRAKFWAFYVGGIDRLSWEASRLYYHRFSTSDGWHKVTASVIDFDSLGSDFVGRATFQLQPITQATIPLSNERGQEVKSFVSKTMGQTLTYSCSYAEYPQTSRLKGVWRLTVHKANNLIGCDKVKLSSASDPYLEIVATSKDGSRCFRQQTSVKCYTVDPVWEETFEIPDARNSRATESALELASQALTTKPIAETFPMEPRLSRMVRQKLNNPALTMEQALEFWEVLLDDAAAVDEPDPPEEMAAEKHNTMRTHEMLHDMRQQRNVSARPAEANLERDVVLDDVSIDGSGGEDSKVAPPERQKDVAAGEVKEHGVTIDVGDKGQSCSNGCDKCHCQ
mmetsp:Transcript_81784/g.227707  ORF Transcript_81784/g.227707 Transcript_81784/m.227707 type:complete len:794 (-) Transcript_81784:131-2512(-)